METFRANLWEGLLAYGGPGWARGRIEKRREDGGMEGGQRKDRGTEGGWRDGGTEVGDRGMEKGRGGGTEGRERRQAQSPTGEGIVASEWSGEGRGLSGPDVQGCVAVCGVWPPFVGGRAEARGTSYSLSGHRRPVCILGALYALPSQRRRSGDPVRGQFTFCQSRQAVLGEAFQAGCGLLPQTKGHHKD